MSLEGENWLFKLSHELTTIACAVRARNEKTDLKARGSQVGWFVLKVSG